jgi:hypothetical protein
MSANSSIHGKKFASSLWLIDFLRGYLIEEWI